jgi:hypothetical protein
MNMFKNVITDKTVGMSLLHYNSSANEMFMGIKDAINGVVSQMKANCIEPTDTTDQINAKINVMLGCQ